MGDWYVWGGFSSPPNRSAFTTNLSRYWADFLDGTSGTMLASEAKTYLPYLRDCGGLSQVNNSKYVPDPNADPYAVAPEYNAGPCSLASSTARAPVVASRVR